MVDISIVIVTYNCGKYIKRCINSCLNQLQSSLNYEVIVVNDGSTDETRAILSELNDPKLKKYNIANSGIEVAANLGIHYATGSFVVRVDADDKLACNYICSVAAYLSAQFGFYYSDYVVIDANEQVIERVDLPEFQEQEIITRGDFLATGTLYSATLLSKLGGYSTLVKNSGLENYELILKLIKEGICGKHIPKVLFYYRRHGLNMSEVKKHEIIKNGEKLFFQMGLGAYRTNMFHPYKLVIQ